jgi:cyclase
MIHFKQALEQGASAVSAGSMFIFTGQYRAVLINYPAKKDILYALKDL